MPTFENYTESQVIKMLYMGHSGAGKTGSLVSLAAAGLNVRIVDLDKGVEVLKDFILNKASIYRQARPGLWTQELADSLPKRMSYVPISDTVQSNSKGEIITKGDSWTKTVSLLNEWKDGELNLGNITSWTNQDVLVIDGLSRLADSALNQQLAMNGRLGKPQQGDYGAAQSAIKRLLWMLYTDEVKCHVIMICHIKPIEVDGEPKRGFPQTVGTAIGPEIGQFFNHTLLAKTTGQGTSAKHTISTRTGGFVQLKTPAPLRVKPEYELATGLAEYFADIRKS